MLAWRTFLLNQRSPAEPIAISFERGKFVQVQDVDALVSCWILQLPLTMLSQLSMVSFVRLSSCVHL